MKVNVEIDCTPLEARQFFGLPDVAADADGGDGQAAAADDGQHRQGFAGSADAELVHLRSQDRRTVSGHVRDHGRPRRLRAPEGQEIDGGRRERTAGDGARLRPPGLFLMLAEARGLFEFNASLLLVAAVDARAEGRRSSGADAAGIPRQRPVDGADAAISEGARLRHPCLEHGPQHRRRRAACAPRCATCSRQIPRARPAARSASSAGAWAASMRAIWRCRRPDMVRSVITLGSPFANDIRATNATRLYEALSGEAVDDNPEIRAGDRRRPAGSGHLDLFAHRRHRELAYQPVAALRYR